MSQQNYKLTNDHRCTSVGLITCWHSWAQSETAPLLDLLWSQLDILIKSQATYRWTNRAVIECSGVRPPHPTRTPELNSDVA